MPCLTNLRNACLRALGLDLVLFVEMESEGDFPHAKNSRPRLRPSSVFLAELGDKINVRLANLLIKCGSVAIRDSSRSRQI